MEEGEGVVSGDSTDYEQRPEREGREGDTEPLPIGNDLPIAHEMVKDDLDARLALGIKRYGQPLQPFNGRNNLKDIYDELLDGAVYLRALLYEREATQRGLTDALAIVGSGACPAYEMADLHDCMTCAQQPTLCPQMRAIAALRSLGGKLPAEVQGDTVEPWVGGPIPDAGRRG